MEFGTTKNKLKIGKLETRVGIFIIVTLFIMHLYHYMYPKYISCNEDSLCSYYNENRYSGKRKIYSTFDGKYIRYSCERYSKCKAGNDNRAKCDTEYTLRLFANGRPVARKKFSLKQACIEYGELYVWKIKKGNNTFEFK
ncbi:hypothetical protein IJC60_05735 [bacterium]|nr:hypothetical protein [bacterium]